MTEVILRVIIYVITCLRQIVIWLVLSSTCHFLADNSLQSADKDHQEMRAVAQNVTESARCRCKNLYISNLQQHRAVLPAIARLLLC